MTVQSKIVMATNLTAPPTASCQSRAARSIEIAYSARVIHGAFSHPSYMTEFLMHAASAKPNNPTNSVFTLGDPDRTRIQKEIRELRFTNDFQMPVALRSVRVASRHFSVLEGSFLPRVILPNDTFSLCTLVVQQLYPSCLPYHCVAEAVLRVKTNITSLRIPLRMYPGRLSISLWNSSPTSSFSDKYMPLLQVSSNTTRVVLAAVTGGSHGHLVFGDIAVGEIRDQMFLITNHNAVPVTILQVYSHVRFINVRVLREKPDIVVERGVVFTPSGPVTLGPRESVFFVVRVAPRSELRNVVGSIMLQTDRELMDILVEYSSLSGELSLEPTPVGGDSFAALYPGQIVSQTVVATSTFPETVLIYNMSFMDPRFKAHLHSDALVPHVAVLDFFFRLFCITSLLDLRLCSPSTSMWLVCIFPLPYFSLFFLLSFFLSSI